MNNDMFVQSQIDYRLERAGRGTAVKRRSGRRVRLPFVAGPQVTRRAR